MDGRYDHYTPAKLEAEADQLLGVARIPGERRGGPRTRAQKEAGILTERQWETVGKKEKYGYFGDMSRFEPAAVNIHIPEDYYARVIG